MRIRYRDDSLLQDGGNGYYATNEDPETLIKLLDKVDPGFKIKNVGCICSGGEVPLLVMAPRFENVTAVDNSRASLMWAMLKANLLRELPSKDVKTILSAPSIDITNAEVVKIASRLRRRGLSFQSATGPDLNGIWSKLTEAEIDKIAKSMGNIQFVHGDMVLTWEKVAKEVGGLDLIYTSNAMTFQSPHNPGIDSKGTGKGGAWPNQRFADLLAPGGYILATTDPNQNTQYYGPIATTYTSPFDIVHSVSSNRNTYTGGMNWAYYLARKKAATSAKTT